ncbi:hypothetical protein BU15DRAFT_75752 [Melanogaster broomeanus]|nr:hypothetical protein BU15DRAFT_75752 [Melanogaster broomeanus]
MSSISSTSKVKPADVRIIRSHMVMQFQQERHEYDFHIEAIFSILEYRPEYKRQPPDPHSARSSSNDLEHLLRDTDTDALSLHSNLGASNRRARQRRRPESSLTIFEYTLFGRPPIYLSDDEDSVGGGTRALATASSSTLDSDVAPLDASTIERLTSPDHHAAVHRERERQRLEERSGSIAMLPPRPQEFVQAESVEGDGSNSGDADDADLGGELYARKKRQSAAWSGSGSDSRSRTSASFSAGEAPRFQNSFPSAHQSIPYPHTEMHLPTPVKKRSSNRSSKRFSAISSATSQSTSAEPYTPVQSIAELPTVAGFSIPQERYLLDGENQHFPIAGLSGTATRHKSLDAKAFLASSRS